MTRTRVPDAGATLALLTEKPLIELWVTEVGSAMWMMDTFASDHDLIVIYANRHYDVLTGNMTNTLRQKTDVQVEWADKPLDVAGMEIGHLIHLLKKGNVNAIWSVMSPQIVSNMMSNPFHRDHVDLRRLVEENPSSETHFSVVGMAHSQMTDAEKRAAVRAPAKSYATTIRTLQFGITLLREKKMQFIYPEFTDSKYLDSINEETAQAKFKEFEEAVITTDLPKTIPAQPFDDYLFHLREKIARLGDYYLQIQKDLVEHGRSKPVE